MDEKQIEQGIKKGFPWIARVVALVAILAFFLPFCSVSCSGQKIEQLSALQISTGKDIRAMGDSERIEGNPATFILLLLPAAVIGISYVKNHIVSYCAYIVEAISVLLYNSYLLKSVEKACLGYGCTVRAEAGYVFIQLHGWIILLLGVIGIVIPLIFAKKKNFSLELKIPLVKKPKEDDSTEPVASHKEDEAPSIETIVVRSDGPRDKTPVTADRTDADPEKERDNGFFRAAEVHTQDTVPEKVVPDTIEEFRSGEALNNTVSDTIEEHRSGEALNNTIPDTMEEQEEEKRVKDLWSRPTGF